MPFSRMRTLIGVFAIVLSADIVRADDPVHLEWWTLMKTPGSAWYCQESSPPQSTSLPSPSPVQVQASGYFRGDAPPPAPSPDLPLCPPPIQQVPFVTYTVTAPIPTPPSCLVSVVEKNGKAYLEIQTGTDATMTCECMTLTIECKREKGTVKVPLKLSIADKQVRIESDCLRANADRLTHGGPGGCVTLQGGVKLKYEEGGRVAQIVASEVAIDLADGRVEIKPVRSTDSEQIFSFWLSFFR